MNQTLILSLIVLTIICANTLLLTLGLVSTRFQKFMVSATNSPDTFRSIFWQEMSDLIVLACILHLLIGKGFTDGGF